MKRILLCHNENKLEMDCLLKMASPLLFQKTADIIYAGQVPHIGVCLLEGEFRFKRGSRVSLAGQSPCIIGIYEMIHKLPGMQTLQILTMSKVCLLGKSDVMAMLLNKKDPLSLFLASHVDEVH